MVLKESGFNQPVAASGICAHAKRDVFQATLQR